MFNAIDLWDWIGPNDIGVWANCVVFYKGKVYKPWLNEEREGEEEATKNKGAKKINTIAPYSKNACMQHITSN